MRHLISGHWVHCLHSGKSRKLCPLQSSACNIYIYIYTYSTITPFPKPSYLQQPGYRSLSQCPGFGVCGTAQGIWGASDFLPLALVARFLRSKSGMIKMIQSIIKIQLNPWNVGWVVNTQVKNHGGVVHPIAALNLLTTHLLRGTTRYGYN